MAIAGAVDQVLGRARASTPIGAQPDIDHQVIFVFVELLAGYQFPGDLAVAAADLQRCFQHLATEALAAPQSAG